MDTRARREVSNGYPVTLERIAVSENDQACWFIHRLSEFEGVHNFELRVGPDLGFKPTTKWASQLASKKRITLRRSEICANSLDLSLRELLERSTIEINYVQVEIPSLVSTILASEGDGAPPEFLMNLEKVRLTEPSLAIDYISSYREKFARDQRARVLAILTSSYRALMRYNEAIACYQAALKIQKDRVRTAELFLRGRSISLCFSRLEEALSLVGLASEYFLRANDFIRAAECQISKAAIYFDLKSKESRRIALHLINEVMPLYRQLTESFQASLLALKARLDPEVKNKISSLREASAMVQALGDLEASAQYLWTAGFLARDSSLIGDAVDLFPSHSGINRSLAGIDLALLLMEEGKVVEGMGVCRQAFNVIDRTRHIPGVEAALTELSWVGHIGGKELCMVRLKEIKERLALCRAEYVAQAKRKLFKKISLQDEPSFRSLDPQSSRE